MRGKQINVHNGPNRHLWGSPGDLYHNSMVINNETKNRCFQKRRLHKYPKTEGHTKIPKKKMAKRIQNRRSHKNSLILVCEPTERLQLELKQKMQISAIRPCPPLPTAKSGQNWSTEKVKMKNSKCPGCCVPLLSLKLEESFRGRRHFTT